MTIFFQKYADISSILIPMVAGTNELLHKNYLSFSIYAVVSLFIK